jgi:hypothetical protein
MNEDQELPNTSERYGAPNDPISTSEGNKFYLTVNRPKWTYSLCRDSSYWTVKQNLTVSFRAIQIQTSTRLLSPVY